MGGGRPSASTCENAFVHNDSATGIVSSLFFLDDLEKMKSKTALNLLHSTGNNEKAEQSRVEVE